MDIICDKMSEQGEAESAPANSITASQSPNVRGGPSNGATRLNDNTSNNSGLDNQSCQC